jgi:hypothetical protein
MSFDAPDQTFYEKQVASNQASLAPLAPRPSFAQDHHFPYETTSPRAQSGYGGHQTQQPLPTFRASDSIGSTSDPGSHSLFASEVHSNWVDGAKAYDGLSESSLGTPHMSSEENQHQANAMPGSKYDPNISSLHQNSITTFLPPISSISDPYTAQLFRCFITVSAPTLSLFERHTLLPSAMFNGLPVPKDQQGIWTYIVPRLALQSPPLLQAMLALTSLQLARLQGASVLTSLKYYHVALRRVAKAVGQPSKRGGIDILAATLLLGYYEVGTAEHQKWNSHLLGACQLVKETDFLGGSKRINKLKKYAKIMRNKQSFDAFHPEDYRPRNARVSEETAFISESEIDEHLVHVIAGHAPAYAEPNDETAYGDLPERDLTVKDIEDYEIRRDLFWWFLKQDAIQSMISSNRLL